LVDRKLVALRVDGWMQKPGFGEGLKAEKKPRTTSTSG